MKFDNTWLDPSTGNSGKNKIVLNSSRLLAAALARKSNNSNIHYDEESVLFQHKFLRHYFRSDYGIEIGESGNIIKWHNRGHYSPLRALSVKPNEVGYTSDSRWTESLILTDAREEQVFIFEELGISVIKTIEDFTVGPPRSRFLTELYEQNGIPCRIFENEDGEDAFTMFFVFKPHDSEAFDYIGGEEFAGEQERFFIRQVNPTALDLHYDSASLNYTHRLNHSNSPVHKDQFNIVCIRRDIDNYFNFRINSVYQEQKYQRIGEFYFHEIFAGFMGLVGAYLHYDTYLDDAQALEVENYLKSQFVYLHKNYRGIQYHAIGVGDPNWFSDDFDEPLITMSGLRNEVFRTIPYYCSFVENYTGTIQSGSTQLHIIDQGLLKYTPSQIDGLTVKIYELSDPDEILEESTVSYNLNESFLEQNVPLKTFNFEPSLSTVINPVLHGYTIEKIASNKITNLVHLKSRFDHASLNSLDSEGAVVYYPNHFTIREHGLFGADANSEINTGCLFNHVMLSGTHQMFFGSGTAIELEFFLKLQ